jgi:colanic acid biosynthesis glycosyl transferase WcaI
MRVVLLNRFFFPDHAPTGVLVSDLAFFLRRHNIDVVAISSRARYGGDGPPLPKREIINGVEIHRVWSTMRRQPGLFRRGLDYGMFFMAGSWRLWRLARRADIIVAKTDPPLLSVMVAAIAKLRGARHINWAQDIFPEVAEALKIGGSPGGLAFRFLKRLRNWSLKTASMNVVVGTRMAAHLQRLGVPPPRTRVIANWSDGQLIAPIPLAKNALRKEWGLDDSFVVGYAGNLGRAHDLDTLVDAITVLHEQADASSAPIVFVFVGGGAQHAKLQREVARRKLSNVQIRPYQDKDRLAEVLGVADVHVLSLKPILEGLIVPSKFYGIAAARRPALFIGALDGEIAQLINQTSCGFTIAPGDAEALTSRILQLASDPKLCLAMGGRARAAFEKHWDKEHAMVQWAEVLKAASDGTMQFMAAETGSRAILGDSLDQDVA